MIKYNMENYKKEKSRVFSGRTEGNKVRERLKLDELDNKPEEVILSFPEDIISLNSSFFLGAFGPSVRKLGKENFKSKYKFECSEFIKRSIEDGIERALKTSNPLESK